ncbi:MAG: oxalate:formate antiporter [Acidobacteria bacterium]|nr:MAG: oxalate:formate antiporter [Acidobacteriota bacterium]
MAERSGIPEPHASFLRSAIARLREDARLVGVGAGGSYLAGTMDEFSDLDLVIAVEPAAVVSVRDDRQKIARSLAPLLVDLKFVSLPDLADRVEDPAVLWERDGRVTAALSVRPPRFPEPDLQWIEDRFWVWVHYGAAKIGRGELFEACDFLAFLRAQVLGPLALKRHGARASGVRRLELLAPEPAAEMRATIAAYDAKSCALALGRVVEMYRRLRRALAAETLMPRAEAEKAAVAYLDEVSPRAAS